ncbi:MAG: carbohydrate ABC transporter permease [Candidatus Flemingiibacterium sp.]
MVKLRKMLAVLILSVLAAVMVLPIVLTVTRSFEPGIVGYIDFYLWKPFYLRLFCNSLLIAAVGALGNVVVSVLAAYVFAKVKFRGSGVLFFVYIVVMMMPFQVTLLPQYIVSRDWGIYNTPAALILPGIFSAFGTFILTQILKTQPDEMIEAAKLETGSTLLLLWHVIIPNLRGGIVCLFVLQFTELWNMVAEPLVLMETELKLPLAAMLTDRDEPAALSATVVFLVLPLMLYLLFSDVLREEMGSMVMK